MLGLRSCLISIKKALGDEKDPHTDEQLKIKWSHVKKKLTTPAKCRHIAGGKFTSLAE